MKIVKIFLNLILSRIYMGNLLFQKHDKINTNDTLVNNEKYSSTIPFTKTKHIIFKIDMIQSL